MMITILKVLFWAGIAAWNIVELMSDDITYGWQIFVCIGAIIACVNIYLAIKEFENEQQGI